MKLIELTILAFLLSSCGNYFEMKDDSGFGPNFDGLSGATVDFQMIRDQIITPHCIKCHKGYNKYESVVKDITKIEDTINAGTMPKKAEPLSSELRILLARWVAGGMINSQANDQTEPTPEPQPIDVYTYKYISENIFEAKCVKCHNADRAKGDIDLSSRQKIFEARNNTDLMGNIFLDFDKPEESYLLKVLKDEEFPMPPKRTGMVVTDEEYEILKEWIKRGLP